MSDNKIINTEISIYDSTKSIKSNSEFFYDNVENYDLINNNIHLHINSNSHNPNYEKEEYEFKSTCSKPKLKLKLRTDNQPLQYEIDDVKTIDTSKNMAGSGVSFMKSDGQKRERDEIENYTQFENDKTLTKGCCIKSSCILY